MNSNEKAPAPGGIPVGLATKLGQAGIAAFVLLGIITSILDGDHTPETIWSIVGALATLLTLMGGRYAQAAAQLRSFGDAIHPGVGGVPPDHDESEAQPELSGGTTLSGGEVTGVQRLSPDKP